MIGSRLTHPDLIQFIPVFLAYRGCIAYMRYAPGQLLASHRSHLGFEGPNAKNAA
jgi:hypothetical protein